MKTVEKEVKLKGKTVETISIEQFETIDEAIAALEEPAVLSLINRMHVADCSNKTRAKYRQGEPGKQKRFYTGVNLLTTFVFKDGTTGIQKLTELAEKYPDQNQRNAALIELINHPEIQAKIDEVFGVDDDDQ